ncbi:uncharacterized protein PV07_09677 [Cladophialophora immunda]|uniref:Uncharacterized protein n=1 Tax=Cladophialophora immunda TaxID=569365 RepID=A0A0D2C067_9EURO|nr:uncharacterized protein PV07_09677 [Cladophialophora immunda]KIW23930.1 hypothetical protein PV07_09677 [Cladophialophora immunda]OQV08331.1 Fungal specific transcription factor domain-containing protein [Cladophialophora immunda]
MLHFVNLRHPSDGSVGKQERRAAQSHSARATHRKNRQLRMIQHQSRKSHARIKELGAQNLKSNLAISLCLSGLLSPDRKDPFISFVRPFKPIEHFLLDHYVTTVIPLMRCNDAASYYLDCMTRAWVPLALTERGLLDAIFLAACRQICRSCQRPQQQQQFMQLACHYKIACIKSLSDSISVESFFSDATVAKTLMLAYDELAASNIHMYRHHVKAAVRMVDLNGGPQTLGLDGFIEHLISNLCCKLRLYS